MRKKAIKRALQDMRDNVRLAAPFDLTFKPCGKMTAEEKAKLEGELRYHFQLWASTWISPIIDAIEQEIDRK